MSTDFDEMYDLAVEQGMTDAEATAWAEANSRSVPPVTTVTLSQTPAPERDNVTLVTGGHGRTTPYSLVEAAEAAQAAGHIRPLIPGMILPGLNLLSGPSRFGKSLMALDMANAVAGGGNFAGTVPTNVAGDVLIVSFEDTHRSFIERLDDLHGGDRSTWPHALELAPMDVAYRERTHSLISSWADRVENPTMVVIDTWAKFKMANPRRRTFGSNNYETDVEHMAPIHAYSQESGIALVVVHHTKQGSWSEVEDIYEKVSGSTGLVGTADQNLIVKWERGANEAEVYVSSRHTGDTRLGFRRAGMWWQLSEGLPSGHMGDLTRTVYDWCVMAGAPVSAAQIVEATSLPEATVRQYVKRLTDRGMLVRSSRGRYVVAPSEVVD